MNSEANIPGKPANNTKVASGLIILFIGVLLLVRQMGIFFLPHWLFLWPSILIIIGLFVGAKSNYKNVSWLIIFLTGMVFMVGKALPGFHVTHFTWPLAIIVLGLFFIMKRENGWKNQPLSPDADYNQKTDGYANTQNTAYEQVEDQSFDHLMSEDYLRSTIIFNNLKKTILSKSFKGGEVTNIFGNVNFNFLQADMNESAVIGVTMLFSKTTIIVPLGWRIVYDAHSVFANVEDKCNKNNALVDNHKTLVLKGSSIFSQVELVSL